MTEHRLLVRDGDDVCAVTLTDIQGDALASEIRGLIAEEFEVDDE